MCKKNTIKIIITDHARLRVIERLGCRADKVEKVAKKAYNSKEKISDNFLMRRKINGFLNKQFRLFSGCVFVFNEDTINTKVLVTCLRYIKYITPPPIKSVKYGIF